MKRKVKKACLGCVSLVEAVKVHCKSKDCREDAGFELWQGF